MGASGVYWNNVPHKTILSQINGGAGATPVIDAAASFGRIAATLRDADEDLRKALTASGVSWEGQAAEDMRTASTPLATWAEDADQLAEQTSSATEVFGVHFADTRGTMPAVVDVPAGSWVDDTGLSAIPGVTTDRERAEAQADAAQHEAARKMEAYDNASYDTVQTQYFSQPPAVTIQVPPPPASVGPGVSGVPTAPSGAPAGAGTYVPPGGWTAPSGSAAPSPVVSGTGGAAGGAAAPSVPGATAPAWTSPASTIPSTAPGGGAYPGGGSTGGGGGVLPPVAAGGTSGGALSGGRRPGGRAGSVSGGAGELPPAFPGVSGRGYGPGGYGAGTGGPGGRGASGLGGLAGFGDEQPHGQRGAGAFGLAEAEAGGRGGLAGRPGGTGPGAGYGSMGGAGAPGEDDAEHKRPDYLVETEDVWGDGTKVAPPVIGERPA